MNLKEITKGGNYSFSEKIIQYMKIMSELMGKKLLVFVNIRSDLEKDQIQELMKMQCITRLRYYLLKIYNETSRKTKILYN